MSRHNNQGRKKKKITYIASLQGIKKAENALVRLGFESKINFSKSILVSRTTVTKFFQGKPIQLDSFKTICNALTLNWSEIIEITEEAPGDLKIPDCNTPATLEKEGQVQIIKASSRLVTVVDKQSGENKAVITLNGDINSVQNLKVIESILREYSGDTIKITDIKEGSIKLFIKGSQEDIQRLVSRINSGELTKVNGFPVEGIQILSESSNDEKWRLVQEIRAKGAKNQNLSGVDLSDADLSGADLSGANLSGADLTDADLSGADLTGADLSGADLSGADLTDTNLNVTNLWYTNHNNTHGTAINLESRIGMETHPRHSFRAKSIIKRCIDIIGATIILILTAPIIMLIAITIKVDSPGPIFFRQKRIGLHGKEFLIWKFRTMIPDAEEKLQATLEAKNEMKDDPRVTKVGQFLRRYSLDALPELFNVLVGEMSLIGPRPLPTPDVEKFQPKHFIRQEFLPGMIELWKVSNITDIEENFEDSVKVDIEYIEN